MCVAHGRFGLSQNIRGVLERTAFGRLHRDDEISGVFVRDKTFRHALIHPVRETQARQECHNRDHFKSKNPAQPIRVTVSKPLQAAVEAREQAARLCVPVPKKQRRERGRKRERVECRDGDGKSDGQSKLAEKNSRRARKESHRNENGNEHERRGHHRAGHFLHRYRSGVVRFRNSLADMALDVLDHHNRVVHHQPRGQRQTEERERINGKSEQFHECEGSN